ncbi:hypothetical protein HOY80DRAFT_710323 [Tuber brumale]|nr:hypothetical protein HOY80DRAFT_710323 [Tuber brumale]
MRSRTVERRSSGGVGSTADFGPILPDLSLGAVNSAGKDEGTHRHNAGVRSSDDRVPINSPLMEDRDGRVYHQIIQACLESEVNVFSLPGPVQPTGIRPISMTEIGQLPSKDLENRGSNCLRNMGGRATSDSALDSAGCAIQEGVDGEPHLRRLKRRSIDGADYIMPFVGGKLIQRVPDLAQAVDGDGEVSVSTGEGAGTSDAMNMTLLLHSMTLDKITVMLPLVMFGTLLLVLVVFGMAFCCLRQAEETYHININAIENRRRRKRNLRRRRKSGASIGAAEEGHITVRPGAPTGQPEVGNTNRGWFLQRWYNSLRGDATPKLASFSGAEVTSQRSPKSNLRRARGLDGGQDTRDPSYILGAVSDRLQQTRGPLFLPTIWSGGGGESSATGKAVLAARGKRDEGASLNTAMMSGRMHGAKGDTSTGFLQEPISSTESTGLSGNPGSDLTLTHSPVEAFTGTSCADAQEALRSEGTFRMTVGGEPSIPDNLREPKEFVRVRPDLYLSGPGAGGTSESSEPWKDSWTGGTGAILRGREGDTMGGEDEEGPSRTVEVEV